MKRLTFLLLCLVISIGFATAQTTKVTGTVTSSEDQLPVIGAAIVVKGTTIGTVSDFEGKFTLDVPKDAKTIFVSYVGLKTKEVAVAPVLNIVLDSDSKALDEVVVTAQGLSRKEKSLGYSTQKVTAEQLTTARQTDLGNAMAGKIAGARFFGKSGSTFDSGKIVLRGSTDFLTPAGSEPIYVIDGSISNKDAV
ncbi:MAG: carboxypeptidase-like regulatory domain-containing protein, partial [Parabacteroides sp.]